MPSASSRVRRSPPTSSLVTALAVGAVTVAALAAAWGGWLDQDAGERPSVQETVHIVQAPSSTP